MNTRAVLASVLAVLVLAVASQAAADGPVTPKPDQASKVRIDKSNRLVVGGRAMFPLGLYLGPSEAEHLARIAEAGFNTVLCYSFGRRTTEEAKAFLDRAHKQGLWVIYSLKDHYGRRKPIPKQFASGAEMAAATLVRPLKRHPALLCWYINDETWPGPKQHEQLLAMYRMVRKEDPQHPAFSVINRVGVADFYADTTDIVAPDPYPIDARVGPGRPGPDASLTMVRQYIELTRRGFGAKAPVWLVAQAFDQGIYDGIEAAREPSFAEMRCMSYIGLVNGIGGLLYYSYADCFRRPGRQNEDDPLLFARRWTSLRAIGKELGRLGPILAAGEPVAGDLQPDQHKPTAWSWLAQARMLRHKGRLYVMVANPSRRPVKLRLTLASGRWKVHGYLQGGAVEATCKGRAVHMTVAAIGADTVILSEKADEQ